MSYIICHSHEAFFADQVLSILSSLLIILIYFYLGRIWNTELIISECFFQPCKTIILNGFDCIWKKAGNVASSCSFKPSQEDKHWFSFYSFQSGTGPSPRGKKGPAHTPKQHRDRGIDFYFSRSKNLWSASNTEHGCSGG